MGQANAFSDASILTRNMQTYLDSVFECVNLYTYIHGQWNKLSKFSDENVRELLQNGIQKQLQLIREAKLNNTIVAINAIRSQDNQIPQLLPFEQESKIV